MKQTNYGNWIPKNLMGILWGISALLLVFWFFCIFFWKNPVVSALSCAVLLISAAMTWYMHICRRAFSYEGGNVMGQIHQYLISKVEWEGNGSLLDIGCGSGALAVLCAKTWPKASITGIDYWGKEWNYEKTQCEENAKAEGISAITFCQGDAASLPFPDESFDAAVSNFVFHEVRTQPDKRQVVREALRVVKKGGAFAFHDLFQQRQIYGSMEDFILQLKKEGISQIYYEPHTERLPFIPGFVKAPWLLKDLGILYGIK